MSDPRAALAAALIAYRERQGHSTWKATADALGVNASTLGDWANGKSLPSDQNLRMLQQGGVAVPSLLLAPDTPSMFGSETLSANPEVESDSGVPAHQLARIDSTAPPKTPRTQGVTEALSDSEAQSLLALVDVVRDPVHGDIQLTALERRLIDTREFQRLRDINQLAPTYLVYPGALHNRFLHSIGTLHVCARMIATCNDNAEKYERLAPGDHPVPVRIGPYAELLARLCALLHDTAHVPFGHTLEKEGRVFARDEWKDSARVDLLFGNETTPGRFLEPVQRFFQEQDLSVDAAAFLLQDVRQVLTIDDDRVMSLPYPFVHDLVGNTICADLIDYVQRDSYFAGLTERCGDRFLRYLAVVPVERQKSGLRPVRVDAVQATRFQGSDGELTHRLMLLQYRYNERREIVQKHDIVAEAVDLVRRRLALAEKLYFHRTKVVASSMLIAAAHAAKLTAMELWDLSDREVIKRLRDDESSPRAQVLGAKLWERHLFRPIYRAAYVASDGSDSSKDFWDGPYARLVHPGQRNELIDRLEKAIGLVFFGDPNSAVGTVTVYCPEREMNVKSFDMLVMSRPKDTVGKLQNTEHGPTRKEIDAIVDMHHRLWTLEVFVDPEVVPLNEGDERSRRLAGAIQKEIGPRNRGPVFRGVEDQDLDAWCADQVTRGDLVDMDLLSKVSLEVFEQLRETVYHGSYTAMTSTQRKLAVRERLAELGYSEDE